MQIQKRDPDDDTTWHCGECGDQLATDADHEYRCLNCGALADTAPEAGENVNGGVSR